MLLILKIFLLVLVLVTIISWLLTLIVSLFYSKVPYVPSNQKIINKVFAELKPQANQIIYDLGCGDGRFLIQAEKHFNTKGIGYELAPMPFIFAKIYKFLSRSKVTIICQDFFKANLGDADIIFCYLYPEPVNKAFKKAQKECRKGTIFVSNTFSVKDIKPFKIINNQKQKPQIYFYQI